jgi:hypothetical protein
LWRASASFTLKPVTVLADGTYLAELTPPRTKDGPPLLVRVIEYTVHTAPADGGTEESSELFCLVTSLLDPEEHPALDLACCYPRRWVLAAVQGERHRGGGAAAGKRGFSGGSGCGGVACDDSVSVSVSGRPSP